MQADAKAPQKLTPKRMRPPPSHLRHIRRRLQVSQPRPQLPSTQRAELADHDSLLQAGPPQLVRLVGDLHCSLDCSFRTPVRCIAFPGQDHRAPSKPHDHPTSGQTIGAYHGRSQCPGFRLTQYTQALQLAQRPVVSPRLAFPLNRQGPRPPPPAQAPSPHTPPSALNGSGEGTRTPDTRIMIPLL